MVFKTCKFFILSWLLLFCFETKSKQKIQHETIYNTKDYCKLSSAGFDNVIVSLSNYQPDSIRSTSSFSSSQFTFTDNFIYNMVASCC